MSGGRLDELMGELGGEDGADLGASAHPPGGGADAFFTARVLDALPEPLGWTGASPLVRVATLLAFHAAAIAVGVVVYSWASPRIFDVAASRAVEATSPWAASLAAVPTGVDGALPALGVVLVVALVAFWATRTHTPAP